MELPEMHFLLAVLLDDSRRKRLQRFLSLPSLTIEKIWFPILSTWLSTYFQPEKMIYVVIDRTAWSRINLFVISVVWDKKVLSTRFKSYGAYSICILALFVAPSGISGIL
jgi:hypothetical protein